MYNFRNISDLRLGTITDMNDRNTNSFNLQYRKTRNRRNCFQKASKEKLKCHTLSNTSLKKNQPTRAHNILGPLIDSRW